MSLERDTATYWCYMRPQGKPIVTNGLLRDLRVMQDSLSDLFENAKEAGERPFSYFVFASRAPGVYSLGGDLDYFARCMRTGDRESIHHYARTCVEVVHQNVNAFNLPVITMALVQGDALGGGFETALSFDLIVAERSAKMGLPEILFNLFPGMGAYSFLSRRLDALRAQKMILSGRIYSAEELHDMGLVDVLAEDGQGEAAVCDYVKRMSGKHNAQYALYQARRRVNPVTWEELRDVVDIWVDAVFQLSESDLKKMARLTAAQDRRLSRAASVPAIAAE
ncbi:MAG: crotonase/enoyl-CoA hydratase family protein [Pseudomonadota bacterium]|nr:crotonase/enoyl-CoA hydratase family protein [Pseudomonadota bacterium]